jgi:hypothetical protein
MSLKKYIVETERSYNYRLKTIVSLDDDAMDRIERLAMKYQPLDISRPRKTIMQKNPLDFTNIGVDAAEVWIVDFEFGLPASGYAFGEEIRHVLGAPEKYVIVRGANDPTEVESERLVAGAEIADEAVKQGLTPSGLLNDPTYSEVTPAENLYGKVHNERFLDYLRTVQKEREAKSKVDPLSPLFKWIDMPKQETTDEGEYNADIPDAPRLGKAGPTSDGSDTAKEGNLDDRKRTYKRQYGKNGERVIATRVVDTAKDPK